MRFTFDLNILNTISEPLRKYFNVFQHSEFLCCNIKLKPILERTLCLAHSHELISCSSPDVLCWSSSSLETSVLKFHIYTVNSVTFPWVEGKNSSTLTWRDNTWRPPEGTAFSYIALRCCWRKLVSCNTIDMNRGHQLIMPFKLIVEVHSGPLTTWDDSLFTKSF